MLACKHCSTPNSLDSTFCKKCGTAVPADQKREAALQLDKLVDEGLSALNAGRTAEALAIADSAVATDPTHLAALQLKSAVHERRGEIADALESADRIVELNPDSELDRIKRNGLRNSLLNASTPVVPDRRVAFVAAGAAMVLVACAAILLTRKPTETTPNGSMASNTPISQEPIIGNSVPVVSNPAQNVAVPTANVQPNTTAVAEGNQPGTYVAPDRGENGGQLPNPRDFVNTDLRPVNPPTVPENPPQNPTTQPKNNPPKKSDDEIDPKTLPPDTEAKVDNGQINIEVSKTGPKRSGGSETIPDSRTNGYAAYARVGTERFGLGDYAGAATNLEKAVQGGGDPVQLNLRLAQAYSRLGRTSEAAQAYERSRSAADREIKSGKGDKERLTAARDAADAGLRTVRGG